MAAGSFTADWRGELVRTRAEVEGARSSPEVQLGDARGEGRFRGIEPEPRAGLRGGHIPGSCNLPFTELIDPETGLYFPPEELRRRVAQSGLELDRPVITLCGSGVTACSLALALELAGAAEVAVYDGSWAEWGRPDGGAVE
jgi:thiosulfate/3-mercaptopyruvate sulfurtransferase